MTNFLHLLTLAFALTMGTPDDKDNKAKVAAMPSNIAVTKSMSMSMYPSYDQSKMNVHVVNHLGLPLKVSFMNEKGDCLATERLPRRIETRHIKFNVDALPTGAYQIVISDGKNEVVKQFQINTEEPVKPSRVKVLEEVD